MRTQLRSLLLIAAAFAAQPMLAATQSGPAPRPHFGAVAPAFVRNMGEADPLARYLSVGGGRPVFFTTNDVRIVDPPRQRSLWLTFVDGAARDIDGEWTTGGHVTVLRHASAATDAPIYRDIVYRSVWRGIDARVSAVARGLKYSFEVAPGADPRAIHLRYSGADRIALTDAGEIAVDAGGSTLVDTRPVAYQDINGRRTAVPVRFVQFESDVAFAVGKYDRTKPLVIDPTLVYSTYLGSGGDDFGSAVAVDATGAAYVAGTSRYSGLPTTPGAYQTTWNGDPNNPTGDAFVAKIHPDGTRFDYVTYLGGSGDDESTGIAVDASGNAYVTGTTRSGDFPVTSGAWRTSSGGPRDGYVAKLNSSGSGLLYSTYFGANGWTLVYGIALDTGGNAYVVGTSSGSNLPVSAGSPPYPGGSASEGFLLKFNASGSGVAYGTYLGAGNTATGVAVTGTTAFIAGTTSAASGVAGNARSSAPVVQPLSNGPSYRSTDGGATFANVNVPPLTTFSRTFVIDPADASLIYQGTGDRGILKSTDGGAHWSVLVSSLGGKTSVANIAVNPATTSTLLATTGDVGDIGQIWRSTDSGATWTQVGPSGTNIAFAPSSPSIAYATSRGGVWKSTDAGATWAQMFSADYTAQVYGLAIDPGNASIVYAGQAYANVMKTTNGGASWTSVALPGYPSGVSAVAVDPTLTNVVWANNGSAMVRSTDSGSSWTIMTAPPVNSQLRMVFDGGVLYVANSGEYQSSVVSSSIVRTADRGDSWSTTNIRGNAVGVTALAVRGSTIFAGTGLQPDAFVQRYDTTAGAQAFAWGTYLGGGMTDQAAGIAIDPSGNVVVAVDTNSVDFPTTGPGASRRSAVARLSPDGTTLTSSAYIGNAQDLQIYPRAIAVDSASNAYLAGVVITGPTSAEVEQVWIGRIDPGTGTENASASIAGPHSNVGDPKNEPTGIAAGSTVGDVVVTGSTNSVDFTTTEGAPQRNYGSGNSDAFVAKVSFGTSSPPPPPGQNLALHKSVTASSEFASQYAAGFAVDGSATTRWSSQFSDPQWIYVDLQSAYDISEVILRWETAYGADYQVQVSNDATNWTTIRTVTGGDGGVDDLTGLSGTGRYVRVNGTRRGTQWGYSLWELEVYGTASTSTGGVPPPWTTQDVGAVGMAGSASYDNNTGSYTVAGSGADIWGTADAFRYVYRPLTGDGSLWVRVLSVQNTSSNAKAGVMFRDGTGANAANVILDVKPDGCAEFMVRDSAGAATTFLATGSDCGLPVLLRLTRTGSTFSADISTDQVNMQHLGSTTITMPPTLNVGLIVTSHDNASLNTSRFDNVMFTAAPPDRALHRPVVSSSDFSPEYAAAYAVDGDETTRWSSQFSESQWIYVDFGQRIDVNEVVLNWETAYARYYQLQVSDDLTNWTTIGQVIDGDGGTDDVTGLSGTGRYLRLVCITRATEWGFSLWSFVAHGTPAP